MSSEFFAGQDLIDIVDQKSVVPLPEGRQIVRHDAVDHLPHLVLVYDHIFLPAELLRAVEAADQVLLYVIFEYVVLADGVKVMNDEQTLLCIVLAFHSVYHHIDILLVFVGQDSDDNDLDRAIFVQKLVDERLRKEIAVCEHALLRPDQLFLLVADRDQLFRSLMQALSQLGYARCDDGILFQSDLLFCLFDFVDQLLDLGRRLLGFAALDSCHQTAVLRNQLLDFLQPLVHLQGLPAALNVHEVLHTLLSAFGNADPLGFLLEIRREPLACQLFDEECLPDLVLTHDPDQLNLIEALETEVPDVFLDHHTILDLHQVLEADLRVILIFFI